MSFNERKDLLKKKMNNKAKQMKNKIAQFPDSQAKSDLLRLLENARRENLRILNELTSSPKRKSKR
jgi:hypothetical protein